MKAPHMCCLAIEKEINYRLCDTVLLLKCLIDLFFIRFNKLKMQIRDNKKRIMVIIMHICEEANSRARTGG